MPNSQYQLPQQPPADQPTGQLLNTNPAPQMPADKNVTSLTPPPTAANQSMTNLGFANNMLHHLIEYKGSKGGKAATDTPHQPQEQQENPKEESQETPKQETQEQPDTSDVDKQITDLQSTHEKEILMLRHELETKGLKDDNKKAIDDLEKKHQTEIDNIKQLIKGAISG